MTINQENSNLYTHFRTQHLKDNGNYPDAYALTELIRTSILNKTYKIYNGGGYEFNTEKPIQKFDVVVWFSFGGDAHFEVCIDNDGDYCELYHSNSKCELLKTIR